MMLPSPFPVRAAIAALLAISIPSAFAVTAPTPASATAATTAKASPPAGPLHDAAASGDTATLRRGLAEGLAVDARDDRGRTPLLVATHHDQVDAARVLIEAGADVNARDATQDSPYLYAGARGRQAILGLTLAHGADLGSTNRFGGTALIPAAERGHVETVRTLIDAGVAIDHINRLGWTALLEAIILGKGGTAHQEIVELLLAAGANPELADGDGVTPLTHARQRGYREIEASLVKAGATR